MGVGLLLVRLPISRSAEMTCSGMTQTFDSFALFVKGQSKSILACAGPDDSSSYAVAALRGAVLGEVSPVGSVYDARQSDLRARSAFG